MGQSLGIRLRSARERQGVALSTIAERTKLKVSLLQALERDDVSQWPRGIFGRSHLRSYARAVGLEPDAVVAEFLAAHPDPDEDVPSILEVVERGDSVNRAPRTRIRLFFDSAIDALHGRRQQRPAAAGGAGDVDDTAAAELSHGIADDSPDDQPRDERTIAEIDGELTALARLCARIGRAQELREVAPALKDALDLIDGVGLVLWLGDQQSGLLTPVLALGYSNTQIARLPRVSRDADNAIAAAVRSGEIEIVDGSDVKTGAVAVPVVTAAGCVGALALELLRPPGERRAFVCAFASILTAQLAALVGPLQRTLSARHDPALAERAP